MPSGLLNVALGLAMQVGSPGPMQFGTPGPVQYGSPGPMQVGTPSAMPYGSPGTVPYGSPSPTPYGSPGAMPYGTPGPTQYGSPGPMQAGSPGPMQAGSPGPMQVGSPGPSEMPNAPAPANAYGRYGFEGSGEPRFPFDNQQNWTHGYFQEIPAYGGHPVFRPYNYKDVLSQSQTAGGWGERPMMPYSQQFWHKYHDQATMLKTSQMMPVGPQVPWNGSQQFVPQTPQFVPQTPWTGHVQTGYTTSTLSAPGHQPVAPSSGQYSLPTPQHVPVQNYSQSGLFDQQGPALQPAAESINPAVYRR